MLDGRRIVFMHMQKTGGTALHNALMTHVPTETVCPERLNTLMNWTPAALARYQVFSGHFTLPAIERIPGPKYIFTIFREPRERLLSYYRFVMRYRRGALKWINDAKDMTLSEYISNGAPSFWSISQQLGNAPLVETAKRLRRFNVIGFTDDIDHGYRRVCNDLGLPPPTRPLPRENITETLRGGETFEDDPQPLPPLTAQDRKLIAKFVRKDRLLYLLALASNSARRFCKSSICI